MKRSGRSSRLGRWTGVLALLVGIAWLPVVAAASGPSAASRTTASISSSTESRAAAGSPSAARGLVASRLSGWSAAPGAVRVGGALWSSVVVSPGGGRSVVLQVRRVGSSRVAVAWRGTTSTSGRVLVGLRPPAAGRWLFRLVAPAAAGSSGAVSAWRQVSASGRAVQTRLSGFVTSPARVGFGSVVVDDVVVAPGSLRWVWVQQRSGSAGFVTRSVVRASSSGAVRVVLRPSSVGAWAFRLVVPATATSTGVVSASRVVTAVDSSAPDAVSGVRVVSLSAGSVGLAWSNPSAPDFAGVSVRRALGSVAPSSVTAGTAVAETPAAASGFADSGLAPSTTYSYALFAHDTSGNVAAAAAITVTTTAPPPSSPTASLVISENFGLHTDRLTVGTEASFDASGSFPAADGAKLVSATMDYGDGSAWYTLSQGEYWGTTHTYATGGVKTVTLTVTDANGAAVTTSVKVTVFAPPTASWTVTSGAAHVGSPVTFAIDAAAPPGAQLSSYEIYVFGAETFKIAGATAPPATQDVTFTIPGSYTVSLRVTDDAGATATANDVVVQVS